MRLPYKEFMMASIPHIPLDDLELVMHYRDKESFKEVYDAYYLEEDVEIYKYNDIEKLYFGFVIIDGNIREWHVIEVRAWHSKDNFLKEINGE